MANMLEVHEMLLEAHAALSQLKKQIAANPYSRSLALTQILLEKKFRTLEETFLEASDAAGIDICTYRLTSSSSALRIKSIGSALADYQTLVSLVYDAQRNGPKRNTHIGLECIENTSFDFGYAFHGSVGFVLTLRNERLLLVESDLDASIQTVFDMAKLATPSEIQKFAKALGPAPMRQLYKWVQCHSSVRYGAEIDWRRGDIVRQSVAVDPADFDVLQATLDRTSDNVETEIRIRGKLIGIDFRTDGVSEGTFHVQTENGHDVRGKFTEQAYIPDDVVVRKACVAKILKTKKTLYFADRDEIAYTLVSLKYLKE
jgi:hypothetical protein